MYDSSQVNEMYDSSQVNVADCFSNNINVDTIIVCNNSIIKDARTKTIYQCGDWKLVTVKKK